MKIILLIFFFFTLNCSINKDSKIHGFNHIEKKYDKIYLNKSNKNDIRKLLGPASSESDFDTIWYYIERKKTSQSILKLGKKKIEKNNILLLEFNKVGIVTNKNLLNLNDMNDIKITEKITEKKFSKDNLIYNILSTLRERINAPTRRNKK